MRSLLFVTLFLLLVAATQAQPDMQDVLRLGSKPKAGTFDLCQNYATNDPLQLSDYYGMPVSVRYDGYSTIRDRDEYSLIINGMAYVFPTANCRGNSMDERQFKLELTWQDEDRKWPIRWWQSSVHDLIYELELRSLVRFSVEKNTQWHYVSRLLQYPYNVENDKFAAKPQTVISPPIMGSQPALPPTAQPQVYPYPYQQYHITPSVRYWRYPVHAYQPGVIYMHPFTG